MTQPTIGDFVDTYDARDSDGSHFTLDLPSGIGAGDTLAAWLTSEYDTAGAFSPGDGWTVMYDRKVDAYGLDNPVCGYFMVKKATGSEGSTSVIAIPPGFMVARCARVDDAADPAVKPPETTFAPYGSTVNARPEPILPSSLTVDDILTVSAAHSTRSVGVSAYPDPDNQGTVWGDGSVSVSSRGSTEYSVDGGKFYLTQTFWSSLITRTVFFPATSYTFPSDDYPHILAVKPSDDSHRTDNELALQMPDGLTSGEGILAVITQEWPPDESSSSSGEDYVFPEGWEILYKRVQVSETLIGVAAKKIATGSEGSSETVEVYSSGEISAMTWRIEDAQGLRIDWRLDEGSTYLDAVRWKSITPLGGSDKFLILAVAHLDAANRLGDTYDTNYNSFGRVDSSGAAVATRFMHRNLNGSSASPGAMTLSTSTNYLSAVFAIYSNTQTADDLRTTQAAAQYAFTPTNVRARATQAAVQFAFSVSTNARLTQVVGQALVAAIPCVRKRCQVWKITRRDGEIFLFTTHDQPVTFHGDTYQPCASLQASAAESSVLNAVGGGDIQIKGLISDESITERDMAFGLFDGAIVEVWQVPWNDPSLASDSPKRLLKGVIGETKQGPTAYEAEMYTNSAKLAQNPLLNTYAPACRFTPGDSKCPILVAQQTATLVVTGVVERIARDRRSFRQFYVTPPNGSSSSSGGPVVSSSGYILSYDHGLLTWTSGNNVGVQTEVKSFDSDDLMTVWDAMPHEVEIGDEATVSPGCAKTEDAHVNTWGLDMDSFGGFPDIPGTDSLIRGPDR